MVNKEEKRSLLAEMIAFSIIDGKLHTREQFFLQLIATEFGFSKAEFEEMFHQELEVKPNKSEFQRIQQFYRLALLMHCDNQLHQKEQTKIREIGIQMGLNPSAIKRMLEAMESSQTKLIDPDYLLAIFTEQHN